MTDYTKPTGNAGTMVIRDTGTSVEFHITCSDPQTNTTLVWSGVVNGQAVGGSTSLPAGFSAKYLGGWAVSSAQRVTFHINATGTQGLGGPTDHAADIPRGPAATVPAAPNTPTARDIQTRAMTLDWTVNGDGGSALDAIVLRRHTSPDVDGAGHIDFPLAGSVRTYTDTTLSPGTAYYWAVYARNAIGYSPRSGVLETRTLSGAYVSDGTTWNPADVLVSDGSAWKAGEVLVSDGATWKAAG